jgi:bifunctional DNase/RNase
MNPDLIPTTIKGVMPTSGGCAVFLGTEHKTFVIHMDPAMGNTITMHLQHIHPERPLTHDLIGTIFMGLGITLEHVTINQIENATFFARIILTMRNELGTKVIELDSRPSDAIVLALQAQKPIFIARDVLEEVEDITDILSKLMEENRREQENDDDTPKSF